MMRPPGKIGLAMLWLVLAAPLAAEEPQMRPVVDALGREVAVPKAPRRVVALHEPLVAVPLLELGVPLVGVYGRDDDGKSLMDVDFIQAVLGNEYTGVGGVGPLGAINVERVRQLQPDLIVGIEQQAALVERLEDIAPVYLQSSMAGATWGVEVERDLARLTGKDAAYTSLDARYHQRVTALRDDLPGEPGKRTYLAIIVFDQIRVVGELSGLVEAMDDLGYVRHPLPDGVLGDASGFAAPLSSEVFMQQQPDLLLVMNSYLAPAHEPQQVQQRLDAIAPGWSRFMPPARDHRVVYLNATKVTTPTLASANYTLAAISDWLRQRD